MKLSFLLFNFKIKISVELCLLVYNPYTYPLQITVCIFRSKFNNHTIVFVVLFQKRSAITCLLVFKLYISLPYLLCWCLPCTNFSQTFFSALRALTNSLATCLLLFNLEITDTQLTVVFQRSSKFNYLSYVNITCLLVWRMLFRFGK